MMHDGVAGDAAYVAESKPSSESDKGLTFSS